MESNEKKPSEYEAVITEEFTTCKTIYAEGEELFSCAKTEIDLVVAGSGVHRIFNQSFPCQEGDVYIVQEHIPHGFFASDEASPVTVRRVRLLLSDWFSGETVRPESEGYCFGLFPDGAPMAYAMLTQQSRWEILQYTDKMMAESKDRQFGWHENIASLLTLLLNTVSRYVQSAVRDEMRFSVKERGVIQEVIHTVDEHFAENDLRLEKMASENFMSTSVLSRLFSQYMGQSFTEYVRSYRLEQVCRLLKETDEPIVEVVQRCGIRDIPSFYRSFQKYTGQTPSHYRKYWKNQAEPDRPFGILDLISEKVQNGKSREVVQLIAQALKENQAPEAIVNDGLVAGMRIVGIRFKNNEVFVPEVLMASRAMNAGLQFLQPYLVKENVKPLGKAVICTVKGDMHDIGKNLVKIMMEGRGITCLDLGVDVSPDRVIEVVREQHPDLVCLSALLTTTVVVLKDMIDLLERESLRDSVCVMVGGAPVTDEYAEEIGADIFTDNAAQAAEEAAAYLKQKYRKIT